ncbi:alpha-L-fucosidase, partial [Nakamurella silvestris]
MAAEGVPQRLASALAEATIPGAPDTIWFDGPIPTTGNAQTNWENRGLPLGNGAMGAMPYGAVTSEQIQLNEKTLWTGGPGAQGGYNYGNWTDGRGPQTVAQVQQMIWNSPTGSITPATAAGILGQPKTNFGSYQTWGDLRLDIPNPGTVTNYRRSLDISESLQTVKYTANNINYTREYFASAADNVIVVRLSADRPGSVSFEARLDLPGDRSNTSNVSSNGRITTKGRLTNNGLRFESQVQVDASGGSRTDVANGRVAVAGADSAVLTFTAATDYSLKYSTGYRNGIDPHAKVTSVTDNASARGYTDLLARHQADYRGLYDRVSLDLGTELPDIPTNQLLQQYRTSITPENAKALESLYFQFGRYLLISSSRAGSLPANLQGVWNRVNNPPWDADYHVNVNFEMNYWPAETTNLTETNDAAFDYIESMAAPGAVTASQMYGARGWVTANETTPYGFTGVHAYAESFWHPEGSAWLAQQFWEHYLFTGDKNFLRDRAYPLMKSISQFWFDFLVVDPRDGKLVVSPSFSPEQGPFSAGTAISQQIVTALLDATAEAGTVLNETDPTFLGELATTRSKIDPGMRVGSWGQLQEWKQDWDTKGNDHRHVSHLWGVFPGSQILSADPKFAAAAKVSLNDRGDGGTGWSKAWKVNLWARFLDGDRAYKLLGEQLKSSTLDNLWDNHPPFQIDGNFGATSGVAEMLVQSHTGVVDVLPALPAAWPDGSYRGLKARGDIEVDASWKSGTARTIGLKPARDGSISTSNKIFASGRFALKDSSGASVQYIRTGSTVTFQARGGERYVATPSAAVSIAAPATGTVGGTITADVTITAVDGAITDGVLNIAVPNTTVVGQPVWSAQPNTVALPAIAAGASQTVQVAITVGPGSTTAASVVTANLLTGGQPAATAQTSVKVVALADKCGPPLTDEFDGAALQAGRWDVLRPNPSRLRVTGGK